MKKIIIFLYILSANQIVAFDYKCVPQTAQCGSKDPLPEFVLEDCSIRTSEQQYLNGNVCSGDRMCADVEAMYDNCLFDKMNGRKGHDRQIARNVCKRIACHPTLIQKFKYR